MARSDEQILESLDGDLRGLLDAKKVPQDIQVLLGRRGVESVELLAVLADDREGVRKFAKDTLGLDPEADPTLKVTVAKLVVGWEAASQRLQIKSKQDAHASTEREPKAIPINDLLGARKKFETQYYQLRDEEIPSKNSLEDMADQLESGDWRAMSLKEIASRADQDSDAQWGSLTVGKLGQVKMKKSAVETPAPKDLEEFRQKLKLLGHHFVFLRMLYPSRKELEDVNPFTFSTYSDYMLSKRVARLQSEDESGQVFHTPSLKQVLTYDYYIRKKAMELLEPAKPLGDALKEASEDTIIKERHFTTPLSVSAAAQGSSRSRSPPPAAASSAAGKGLQKGKKGKKSKGKGKGGLHSVTPEGRQICYAYNSQWERCDGSCGRLHVCQACFGNHPVHMHSSELKKTAPASAKGGANPPPA
eukprot:s1184_g22.t1